MFTLFTTLVKIDTLKSHIKSHRKTNTQKQRCLCQFKCSRVKWIGNTMCTGVSEGGGG